MAVLLPIWNEKSGQLCGLRVTPCIRIPDPDWHGHRMSMGWGIRRTDTQNPVHTPTGSPTGGGQRAGAARNAAHCSMSWRRFSNRSVRR